MSTWNNESDVYRDLHRLSGLTRNIVSYPSLHAFGRGRLVIKKDAIGRETTVAQFSPPTLPNVGNKPEDSTATETEVNGSDVSAWERDRELIIQLRQVCGRGYSNELIEEEFGSQECFTPEPLLELPSASEKLQEDDENDEEASAAVVGNGMVSINEHESLQNKHVPPPLKTFKSVRLFIHPPKLNRRRNALLNSLARMKPQHEPAHQPPVPTTTTCTSGRIVHSTELVSIPTDVKELNVIKISNSVSSCESPSNIANDNTCSPDTWNAVTENKNTDYEIQLYPKDQKQLTKNWADIRKHKVKYSTSCNDNFQSKVNVSSGSSPAPEQCSETKSETDALTATNSSQDILNTRNCQSISNLKPESKNMMLELVSDKLMNMNWVDIHKNKRTYSVTNTAHALHNVPNKASEKTKSEISFCTLSDAENSLNRRLQQSPLELKPEYKSGTNERLSYKVVNYNSADTQKHKAMGSNTNTINVESQEYQIIKTPESSYTLEPERGPKLEIGSLSLSDAELSSNISQDVTCSRKKLNPGDPFPDKVVNVNWADIRKRKAAYPNSNNLQLKSNATYASSEAHEIDSEINKHSLLNEASSVDYSEEASLARHQQKVPELVAESINGFYEHFSDTFMNFYCEAKNSDIIPSNTQDYTSAMIDTASSKELSWQSLKKHTTQPRKTLLSDYIDLHIKPSSEQPSSSAKICNLTYKSEELKIDSIAEFPPL